MSGDKIGDIYDAEIVTVQDKTFAITSYPILDDNGSWQIGHRCLFRIPGNKIGNFNPDFIDGVYRLLSVIQKVSSLNMTFDWRYGGGTVASQNISLRRIRFQVTTLPG